MRFARYVATPMPEVATPFVPSITETTNGGQAAPVPSGLSSRRSGSG
ncbi:hypothetical protein ACFT7S_32085 [Streptomyces sp. NPDC057136]